MNGRMKMYLALVVLSGWTAFGGDVVREKIPCGDFSQFPVVQNDGKTNVVSVCGFDEKAVRVDVVAPPPGELRRTSRLGREHGAIAALNGSYYIVRKPWPCENYLAIDGRELAPGGTNAVTHTPRCNGMVYTRNGRVFMSQDPDGRKVDCEDAMASGPVLLLGGRRTDLSVFPARDSFYRGRHPRSAIGRTADGRILLVTVDGRAKESVGMTIPEMQDLMVRLQCRDAVNLDGGGSTTLWADGEVRNHPCDNGKFDAAGERKVQNAIVVTRALAFEPTNGSVVPLVPEAYKRFLALPREERKRIFTNATERTRMRREFPPNRALPVRFSWPGGPGELVVQRLSDNREFYRGAVDARSASLTNFEIACDYRWRVTPKGGRPSDWQVFRTEDVAPRLIDWPGIPNVRDLGGRKGLDGRRVRQGLVYRSAGLNGNASGNPGERKPGAVRLTAETARWGREWLGIRTDLDLRGPSEVEFMTGSPLGPDVRWVNIPALDYGGLGGKKGRARFVECFRVFLDKRNYPVDFHCIAGADRTGSLACILNGLLGVEEEELYRDWEVTGLTLGGTKFQHGPRFDALMKVFGRYPGKTVNERIEAYVRDCGITADEIEVFRGIMLEK